MVELTVQVSDEVATRLEPIRQNLPALLQQIASAVPSDTASDRPRTGSTTATPVYNEILSFLMAGALPQTIWDFKVSAEAQERLQTLLENNREATLSEAEQAELDTYEQIDYLLTLLKARAYHQLQTPNQGLSV